MLSGQEVERWTHPLAPLCFRLQVERVPNLSPQRTSPTKERLHAATGWSPFDSEVPGFSDVEMTSGVRWAILQPESQGALLWAHSFPVATY